MRKRVLAAVSGVAVFGGLFASSATAAPPDRGDDPFVCPVLTVPEQAQGSGQFADLGNGESTILPGNAGSAETFNGNVPSLATNGDGSGSAGGAHSAPGDTDYSAVWSGNSP
jgi:ABC-type phosphate transport system substrate-binding protein